MPTDALKHTFNVASSTAEDKWFGMCKFETCSVYSYISGNLLVIKYKWCCIDIHLTINPFTFKKDYICKLIVSHYQNKMLYNRLFIFRYKFYGFIDVFTQT